MKNRKEPRPDLFMPAMVILLGAAMVLIILSTLMLLMIPWVTDLLVAIASVIPGTTNP